ncbi:MAG: hypothetical protein HQL72_13130 [Magnetococcales bacterium]|nr:hypothetical protein [Magnetococcales bacterium]
MNLYFNQLRQLIFLRFLIFLFFLLVVHNGYFGVSWSEPIPSKSFFIYPVVALLGALSLFYLKWLESGKHIHLSILLQCGLDPVWIALLIFATGGLDSPFSFLFGVAILNTAFLLGQRQAFIMAGMILICSVGLVTLIPFLQLSTFNPGIEGLNRLVFQGIGFILTALLAGVLANRIGGIKQALDRQSDSLADLTSLHYQIIHALPHALISTNLQGIIRDINPGAETLLKVSANQLRGQPLHSHFPAFQWAIDKSEGENLYLEFKQGEQILGANISQLTNQHQHTIGSLLVIRDLTTLKSLQKKLAVQEKLSLTGQMAAGVAHEIRNPLASILSAAQMFDEEKPRHQKLKRIILEEVERLKQLTTDFLVFSRPTQPARQSLILRPFLADLTQQIQSDPRWGEQRTLVSNLSEKTTILFDPNQLRQIVWNLLINAAQAAPDGGVVTLSQAPCLEEDKITIIVEDDGPGLESGLFAKVLEPFFTTRSSGTGLGLAVVAQLVRLNGGDIQLQPGRKKGLRVLLTMEGNHG